MGFSPDRSAELFQIGRDLAGQAVAAIHNAAGLKAEDETLDPEKLQAAMLILTAMTAILRVSLYKTFDKEEARDKYLKLADELYTKGKILGSKLIQ